MRRYLLLAALASVSLGGCSTISSVIPFFKSSNGPNYQDAKVLKPLEVPPDLLATAPQPGVTIPQGQEGSTAAAASTGTTAGFGVFTPRLAAGEQPLEEKKLPGSAAVLSGTGANLQLSTAAKPAQVWASVKAVLAEKKIPVEQFSLEKGELKTGWRNFREGLSFILGSSVAPTFREKYTFTLTQPEQDREVLAIAQERWWNNPDANWQKSPPDVKHDRDLMQAIQKQLGQETVMAEMPKMEVTRYRDDRGPYLVLDVLPQKAAPAVQMALQGMGYQVTSEGIGVWVVDIRNGGKQSQEHAGFVGGIWNGIVNSFEKTWGSSSKPKAIAVRVKLLRMENDKGSVLETEPTRGDASDGQKWSAEILDKLQTALSQKTAGQS
ncbi:MAG: outer membrane protein assembly factor BamC [Acidithiobacillus sp.]